MTHEEQSAHVDYILNLLNQYGPRRTEISISDFEFTYHFPYYSKGVRPLNIRLTLSKLIKDNPFAPDSTYTSSFGYTISKKDNKFSCMYFIEKNFLPSAQGYQAPRSQRAWVDISEWLRGVNAPDHKSLVLEEINKLTIKQKLRDL